MFSFPSSLSSVAPWYVARYILVRNHYSPLRASLWCHSCLFWIPSALCVAHTILISMFCIGVIYERVLSPSTQVPKRLRLCDTQRSPTGALGLHPVCRYVFLGWEYLKLFWITCQLLNHRGIPPTPDFPPKYNDHCAMSFLLKYLKSCQHRPHIPALLLLTRAKFPISNGDCTLQFTTVPTTPYCLTLDCFFH